MHVINQYEVMICFIGGWISAQIGIIQVNDTMSHLVALGNRELIDLIKILATPFFSFLGSALALYVNYKIKTMTLRKEEKKNTTTKDEKS